MTYSEMTASVSTKDSINEAEATFSSFLEGSEKTKRMSLVSVIKVLN